MAIADRIVRSAAALCLPFVRDNIAETVKYSGLKKSEYFFTGVSHLCSVLGLVVAYVIGRLIGGPYEVLIILGLMIGLYATPLMFVYFYLYFKAESRSQQVNGCLPDVLHMIAANLRSGMTPFEAVRIASTHDFGALSDEFKRVTSRSQGQVSFADMMQETSLTIRSDALKRSMTLFASSIRSGAHLAELLDGLAKDITERQSLRRELIINTSTNAMFIMFTIVVGTPVLLAISIYFVDVVTSLQSTNASSSASSFGALGGFGGELSITAGFLTVVSYVLLAVTGVLATMFVGSMIDGDPKKGLKWAPLLVIASFGVFFVARFLINFFLGSSLVF